MEGCRCRRCSASPRPVARRAVRGVRARLRERPSAVPRLSPEVSPPPPPRGFRIAVPLRPLGAPGSRACGLGSVPRFLCLLPPFGRLGAGPGGDGERRWGQLCVPMQGTWGRSPPLLPEARPRPARSASPWRCTLCPPPGPADPGGALPSRSPGGAVWDEGGSGGGSSQLSSLRWVSARQRGVEVRTEQAEVGREQNCACHSRLVLFLDSKPP